jgi:hypothetical protein
MLRGVIDCSSRLRGLGWARALLLSLAACGPPASPTAADDGGPAIVFHFADDVGRGVRDGMRATFEAAARYWGDPGPMEFWVAGRDVDAARGLARRFCELRASSGQRELDDCLADEGRSGELVRWAERARAGEVFFDAGWNGGFQWGLHLFSSSLPPGMAGSPDVRVEDDRTVLLHEYFHAVQQSHVSTLDWEERQGLMGPVWWVEGSADFMAQVACHELHEAGALPPDPRFVDQPWRSSDRMELALRAALAALAERPGLRLSAVDYGPDAQIAYGLGAWAVGLLCHRHGVDVLLERFYPALEEHGWEGAFVRAFGIGSDEFLREFDAFLELEPDQRRSILPWD